MPAEFNPNAACFFTLDADNLPEIDLTISNPTDIDYTGQLDNETVNINFVTQVDVVNPTVDVLERTDTDKTFQFKISDLDEPDPITYTNPLVAGGGDVRPVQAQLDFNGGDVKAETFQMIFIIRAM